MLHYRALQLENPNDADRTVEASLSSETPYFRNGVGNEILSHAPGAIDLSRSPLPVLTSHNSSETPVAIVENLRVSGGKLRGVLRFGASQRALEVWKDVQAGVLRNTSVGYQIITGTAKGKDYLVSRWMPYEVSLVSVPADVTVGIGRSFNEGNPMETNQEQASGNNMSRSQRRALSHVDEENRDNTKEILATAVQFKIPTRQVIDFMDEHGTNVERFRKFVLSNIKGNGAIRVSESPEIGLTQHEAGQFSFVKAIQAKLDPSWGQRYAGFEMEASRAVAAKIGREPQGIFVPPEVMMSRDLAVGTPSTGGYLRPTEHLAEGFIDLLRKRALVIAMGATQIHDLRGQLSIPSQVSSGTAYWVAEGSSPTESGMAFGQVLLEPKTIGGWTDYTRKMVLQASPDIENLVRRDLASIIAVELDRTAINGSGSGAEPLGVLNTTGIGNVTIGTDGGAPTWAHMLALEEALATVNADVGSVGYITNPKVRRKLKGTTKASTDSGAGFVWDSSTGDEAGFGRINGYRAASSNNVPSNLVKGSSGSVCSSIVIGNWADLVVGHWGALDILVDQYSLATSGGFRVVALLDCDIGVRRAASFAAIKDALTS